MATKYLKYPFGVDGDRSDVPNAPQIDGSISWDQGFGVDYQLDPATNPAALDVPRTTTNQVFFDISNGVKQYQENGFPEFISTADNDGDPFPYDVNAVVRYDAGSGFELYRSLETNNTTLPTDATKWALLLSATGIPANVVSGTTYNPLTADLGYIIERSNSGTGMAGTLPGTSGALAANWFSYIQNNDATANIAMGVGAGGSIRVGVTSAANAFVVNPGDLWLVISFGTGNYIAQRIASGTLRGSPASNGRSTLAGAWASNTTANWTANALVTQDSAGNTKRITSFSQGVNTATTGIGGKTAALSNSTWYPVYGALNPTSGAVGAYIDAGGSYTSPTLVTGYTYTCLIGAVYVDGSGNLQGFTQADTIIQFNAGKTIATGGAGDTNIPTYVAATVRGVTSLTPPIAMSIFVNTVSVVNDGNDIIMAPNANYGAHLTLTNPPPFRSNDGSNGGVIGASSPGEMALESNSIYYAIAAGGGGSNQGVFCYGFRINL